MRADCTYLARQFGTCGAIRGDHRIVTVGRRTPARVGVDDERTAQRELLVFVVDGDIVRAENAPNVRRVHRLVALPARERHARFADCKGEVLEDG